VTARFLVGDVFDRLVEVPGGSVDLVLTSPPFGWLRSYLPADHPRKGREIGQEATPAAYLDALLRLTVELGRVLTRTGSLAVELGDTYAGSGGGGGDYLPGGLREGQPGFTGSGAAARDVVAQRAANAAHWRVKHRERAGWPLDKSLCGLPHAYLVSLAYGRNVLAEPFTAEEALRWVDDLRAMGWPAERALAFVGGWVATHQPRHRHARRFGPWRVRTLKPWIRANPPVGSLADKDRPATSYVVVATRARDRWFDLDAVRHPNHRSGEQHRRTERHRAAERGGTRETNEIARQNEAGAPPLDWYHEVDAALDAALRKHADRATRARPGNGAGQGGSRGSLDEQHGTGGGGGIRGWHLRRALEQAGVLTTAEALDVTARGYTGGHHAAWPAELVKLLVDEMCPRSVCRRCGEPSRRVVDAHRTLDGRPAGLAAISTNERLGEGPSGVGHWRKGTQRTTTGWTSCGCPGTDGTRHDGFHTGRGWRRGVVLDPFAGSGTTGAVATGMGRDGLLIDIDERNVELARQRIGLFLEVDPGDVAEPVA
jgi:hypothetical protein